jgi:hypothetical protein
MHTSTHRPVAPYAPPAPAASPDAATVEAIDCILHGRPLPTALRPATVFVPRPATTAEGIARILAGRPGTR